MKHWTNSEIRIDDEVSYRAVSMWERRGVVVELTPVWAMVQWKQYDGLHGPSREWIPNLQAWREEAP